MNRILIVAIFVVALNVVTSAQNPDLEEHWKLYKETFRKEYSRAIDEEHNRRLIWEENLKYIENHNRLYDLGHKSFRLGLNQFTDLTNTDFQEQFTSFLLEKNVKSKNIFKKTATLKALPNNVDWREKGVVTQVKDQGHCGACWAFSTTGSVEAQHALKNGTLVSLSEQNLIDCSGTLGTGGCKGGWMDDAFRYIIINKGIDTEASYPYEAAVNKCRFKRDSVGGTVKSYADVQKGDEGALKQAVAQVGPISITLDASNPTFQHYKDGIYYEEKCNSREHNHAVLIVGYDTENGQDYWLIKNSWNITWGIDGYMKMSRNKNNHCGIASHASYPIV